MTAAEARAKALDVNKIDYSVQVESIREGIEGAARNGQFQYDYHKGINEVVKKMFTDEGYTFESHYNATDGLTITIKW